MIPLSIVLVLQLPVASAMLLLALVLASGENDGLRRLRSYEAGVAKLELEQLEEDSE